ncbi:hypothetical protein AX17_004108 [Amanita inopinata Kibby_2008]|nr:hypothetical protein AX17_004108 [Amanita inopinata Kibby_2008]
MFPRSLADNIGILFTNVTTPLSWNFDQGSLLEALRNRRNQFLLDNPLAMWKKYLELESQQSFDEDDLLELEEGIDKGYAKALIDWLDGLSRQPTNDILDLYKKSQDTEHQITNALSRMSQLAEKKKDLKKKKRSNLRKAVNFYLDHRRYNVKWEQVEDRQETIDPDAEEIYNQALKDNAFQEKVKEDLQNSITDTEKDMEETLAELGDLTQSYAWFSLSRSFAQVRSQYVCSVARDEFGKKSLEGMIKKRTILDEADVRAKANDESINIVKKSEEEKRKIVQDVGARANDESKRRRVVQEVGVKAKDNTWMSTGMLYGMTIKAAFSISTFSRVTLIMTTRLFSEMGAYYDEIEIEDMAWDAEKRVYHYPCPCGDRFEISRRQLANYEDIATCPSCSLVIRVVYDPLDFEDEPPDDEEEEGGEEWNEEEEDESSDDDQFEDALDRLHLDEAPHAVAVAT